MGTILDKKGNKYTLYKHQVDLMYLSPRRHLCAWGTGTGKTMGAIALARINNVSTLIVCPKIVKEKWQREAAPFLKNYAVYTKEEFRRDVESIPAFEAVIIDEVHHGFGNMKAKLHKAMAAYLKNHRVDYRWFLTGTPYTSTPWSIYGIAKLLGYKWNYMDFKWRYFQMRHLGSRVIFEPREGIEDEIADLVKQIGSTVRLDECIDVPEQTDTFEYINLTKQQKDKIAEIKDRESNPLTRLTKFHQAAQGVLLGDEFTPDEEFEATKNKRILDILHENDKVAVISRYNKHLDLLQTMIEKEGIPVYMITGKTKDRDSVIENVDNSKRCAVLINSECSMGYELPSISVIVFASLSFSYVNYEQVRGRFMRINRPTKNIYIHLITKKSADIPVMAAMKRKENFQESIYARNNPQVVDKGLFGDTIDSNEKA